MTPPTDEARVAPEQTVEPQPSTEAGERLYLHIVAPDEYGWPTDNQLRAAILAIEREAAAVAAPALDRDHYEAMRSERGWPTPNHMRHAADALDMLVIPRYGDILRWVADLCDGLSQPSPDEPTR